MKIALCISGSIRSFPREIFRKSFENLKNNMPEFDVFVVLKTEDNKNTLMNNEKSIDEFIKTMSVVKPKKVFLFNSYVYKRIRSKYSLYATQMLMIKKSFDIAMEYNNYDYFIRYRPDFIMFEPKFDINLIDENTIYTTRKFDSPASDQLFMISKKVKNIWFDKLEYISVKHKSPEYHIFNQLDENIKLSNGKLFYGGLLRNIGNEILFWDEQIENLKFTDTITLECSDKKFIEENFLAILYDRLLDLSKKMNFDIEIKNKI